jgi:hypothetical protein
VFYDSDTDGSEKPALCMDLDATIEYILSKLRLLSSPSNNDWKSKIKAAVEKQGFTVAGPSDCTSNGDTYSQYTVRVNDDNIYFIVREVDGKYDSLVFYKVPDGNIESKDPVVDLDLNATIDYVLNRLHELSLYPIQKNTEPDEITDDSQLNNADIMIDKIVYKVLQRLSNLLSIELSKCSASKAARPP